MKELHNAILNHTSIRKYKNQDIQDEHLRMMLDAIMHSPTSINGQQFSVVVVKEQKLKDEFAKLTGEQPWISQAPIFLVFLADFNRVAKAMEIRNVDFENMDSIEATLVGAVDCGIAFGSVMSVAETLGYGTVPIGAIRKDPKKVIELLELPKYVYPILGMCIGVPDEKPALKPRFKEENIVHYNKYTPITKEQLDEYDNVILKYMNERTQGQDVRSWSDLVTRVYKQVYFPEVKPTLEQQGFKNEK